VRRKKQKAERAEGEKEYLADVCAVLVSCLQTLHIVQELHVYARYVRASSHATRQHVDEASEQRQASRGKAAEARKRKG
jgi:hypothetical protein